ncbi:hypothetical protein Ae201684_008056 [Aphanomyces euteiches]|uniref:Uncharacterized protein n=1 Tax=Aphanomyces euteiches TaxID=100861 RepID=A0A6G0X6A8_9STRA|nr:hypothetical protein Ae201684_008056 [Aphanomyces euteiches]
MVRGCDFVTCTRTSRVICGITTVRSLHTAIYTKYGHTMSSRMGNLIHTIHQTVKMVLSSIMSFQVKMWLHHSRTTMISSKEFCLQARNSGHPVTAHLY